MNIHDDDDDDDEHHHPKEYSEWPKKKKFHSGFNTVKKNIEIEIQFHSIFFRCCCCCCCLSCWLL